MIIIDIETEEGHTYEIEYSTDHGETQVSLVSEATLPYEHSTGNLNTVYRVRDDTGGEFSLWTPWFYGTPGEVPVCKIFGYIKSGAGSQLEEQEVVKFIPESNFSFANDFFFSSGYNDKIVVYINDEGYFEAYLAQGISVNMKIPCLGINRDFIVPSLSESSINDIL